MTPTTEGPATRPFVRGRLLDVYGTLCSRFQHWRIDADLLRSKREILAFVQGLRFSALLIYAIRQMLTNVLRKPALTASWGVIYDDATGQFSRECDVIIHHHEAFDAWNGGDSVGDPVMDFRFVSPEYVRLVISCKSQLDRVTRKMAEYAQDIQQFTDRLWLFAECCQVGKVAALSAKAREVGYERLWYLYALERGKVGHVENDQGWLQFANELAQL